MSKKIAIINQKGGVGKTTTTATLAVGLAKKGMKVLVVDGDHQGSVSICFGLSEPDEIEYSLAELLQAEISCADYQTDTAILKTNLGVDLLPSNANLASIEIPLASAMQREYCLKRILSQVEDVYDYIIIDGPPALNLISVNILSAADEVIVPVKSDYLSSKGMQLLFKTINQTRNRLNSSLQIRGILITMSRRTNLASAITESIRNAYGALNVFSMAIPLCVSAEEATTVGETVLTYAPKSSVALAYQDFVEEFLESEV